MPIPRPKITINTTGCMDITMLLASSESTSILPSIKVNRVKDIMSIKNPKPLGTP